MLSRQQSNDSESSEVETPVKTVSYDHCVQEVMLRREGGKTEYMERLVHFVISRWRLPSTRAAFEELLLRAIHGIQEANAICAACSAFLRYISCFFTTLRQAVFSLSLSLTFHLFLR